MKKLISILLLLAGTAYADWKLNPYTQRQDYYEATGALITSTGTINAALNAEIARATARENAIAVSTGTLGSRVGAAEAALSTAAYTTNSYANPAWITSLASSKLSGTVPTGLVDLSTVATALDGKLTAPATFYVVKASDYLQAPATSYWVKASDYLQAPATFYVVPASAYLQNPATFYIATSADLSAKVSKTGDTMTGPLTLSGSSLTVTGNKMVVSATGGALADIMLTDNNGGYDPASDGLHLLFTGADAYLANREVGPLHFYTNGSERMLMAADGAVTIPGSSFSVGGSTLVVSGGKVGVGTNAPDHLLTVKGGGLKFAPSDTINGYVWENIGSPSYNLNLKYKNPTDVLTDILSVTYGGNVGIGDTAPTAKLVVNGNIHSSGTITATTFSGGAETGATNPLVLRGGSGANNGAYITFKENGTDTFYIGANAALASANDDHLAVYSKDAVIFKTGASFTEAARITGSGNVGIGTTAPTYKLQVVGPVGVSGGIDASSITIGGVSQTVGYPGVAVSSTSQATGIVLPNGSTNFSVAVATTTATAKGGRPALLLWVVSIANAGTTGHATCQMSLNNVPITDSRRRLGVAANEDDGSFSGHTMITTSTAGTNTLMLHCNGDNASFTASTPHLTYIEY